MSRSDFTIGTHQLSAAESVLIRTLVRLYAHDDSFNWVYQATGPWDAVVVNGSAPGNPGAHGIPAGPAVLRIVSKDQDTDPNTLARPIRAEKLQAWLKTTAIHLLAQPHAPQVSAPMPLQSASDQLQTRFKLRRWPPSALMRNDPSLIRISTLLSRRSLRLTELAELSQQSLETCSQFVHSLQPTGLLELESVPATLSGTYHRSRRADVAVPVSFGKGLISGIRRRLGL